MFAKLFNRSQSTEVNVDNAFFDWVAPEDRLKPGVRVRVNRSAGFHKGAEGVVEYHAPDGFIWVIRNGAGSAVWYKRDELDLI